MVLILSVILVKKLFGGMAVGEGKAGEGIGAGGLYIQQHLTTSALSGMVYPQS